MKNNIKFAAFAIFFLVVQLWFIHVEFSHSISGIYVIKNADNKWQIEKFDVKNVADQYRLHVGDMILQVDNKAPDTFPSVVKWRTLDQARTILISHSGESYEIALDQMTFLPNYDLLPIFGELICVIMACFLYIKMANFISARYLSYVFFSIGFTFMGLGSSVRGDALGKIFVITGVMLLPIIFLHFLMKLFEEKGNLRISTKMIPYIYSVVILTCFMQMLFFFVRSDLTYDIYSFIITFALLFFILGLLLNFFLLFRIFLKHRKEKTSLSTVIKTVWFSLFISFSPLVVFSFIPNIVFGHEWINAYYLSWFVLILPISFSYLILANLIYDIATLARRIMITTIISLLPSSIIVSILLFLFPESRFKPQLLFFFVILVIAQSFILYSLEFFTTKLQSIIFPRKHYLQIALKKISGNLGSISNFHELGEIVLVDIVNTLEVYGGAIVIRYKDSVESVNKGQIDDQKVRHIISSESPSHPEYTIMKINCHEEYTSYLIMEKKRSNTLLSTEEVQWLNIIISYLAVSLENLHLIRKLTMRLQQVAAHLPNEHAAQEFNWFRKLTFELQEKERLRIATDLHDTTMQDLFFLKGKIDALFRKFISSEEDSRKLNGILDYITIINTNLRQNCFELNPYLLQEIGLVQTVQKVMEKEELECPFEIQFSAENSEEIEQLDSHMKKHVFRIIQELLNNAKKHSNAKKVILKLRTFQHYFCLLYEDDGVGINQTKAPPREIGSSGMGMEQMKSRVFYLNGRMKMISHPGQGVRMRFIIPMMIDLYASSDRSIKMNRGGE